MQLIQHKLSPLIKSIDHFETQSDLPRCVYISNAHTISYDDLPMWSLLSGSFLCFLGDVTGVTSALFVEAGDGWTREI